MTVDKIGYGAGTRDFDSHPNLLRVLVGVATQATGALSGEIQTEDLCLLETNLDDISGELVGHCVTQLMSAGALDVFSTAVQMKKYRPGVLLSVLCRPADSAALEAIIFRETTTLGVRRSTVSRSKLPRIAHQVQTRWGAIDGVLATLLGGERRLFAGV